MGAPRRMAANFFALVAILRDAWLRDARQDKVRNWSLSPRLRDLAIIQPVVRAPALTGEGLTLFLLRTGFMR